MGFRCGFSPTAPGTSGLSRFLSLSASAGPLAQRQPTRAHGQDGPGQDGPGQDATSHAAARPLPRGSLRAPHSYPSLRPEALPWSLNIICLRSLGTRSFCSQRQDTRRQFILPQRSARFSPPSRAAPDTLQSPGLSLKSPTKNRPKQREFLQ